MNTRQQKQTVSTFAVREYRRPTIEVDYVTEKIPFIEFSIWGPQARDNSLEKALKGVCNEQA